MTADLNVALSPTTVATGASGHAALHTQEREYIEALRSTVQAFPVNAGTTTLTDFGAVSLDAFSGADDDAKLTNALSATAADTFPRTIQLRDRQYSFATMNRTPFEGLRIKGPDGYGNPERGFDKMPGRVHLSGAGAWFANNTGTDVFSVSLHNLSFTGGSGAWVIGGANNWYCLSMRDIFTSNLRSVVGSIATKALLTAASFTGDWEVNNSYDLIMHAGGSDNAFWTDGGLMDSATGFAGDGQAHLWFDGMDKSYIGPLYITAEGSWSAIRVTGSAFGSTSNNQGGPLNFEGLRIEGRNPGAPSYGRLASVEGGVAILSNCVFNYAMADPSNAALGRTDLGVIMHTGGQLDVNGCSYDRASTVATSVPFVYTNTTADAMVTRIKRTSRGGVWGTARPIVARPSANADNIIVSDASITKTSI